jgi:hypothetical protein
MDRIANQYRDLADQLELMNKLRTQRSQSPDARQSDSLRA